MLMKKSAVIVCAVLALCLVLGTAFGFRPYYYKNLYIAPIPTNLSVPQKMPLEPIYADYFVSATGSDSGDGSFEQPFATLKKAQDTVRKLNKVRLSHVIVAVLQGSYKIEPMQFTELDSGTNTCSIIYSAYGDGEVILDGGIEYAPGVKAQDTALIDVNGANYVNFSGFTVKNCPGDAFRFKGDWIGISVCIIENIAGCAISANGEGINISNCDISHIGKSGITITGGERKTLKPGNCAADNNLLRNICETEPSYPAVYLGGVGNVLTNNDIYNTPNSAVYYSGNGNKIEYNYIHNAVLSSSVAPAVYSDISLDDYGNFIRYNCISTLGDGKNKPGGIKSCSGTHISGNILINIPGYGIDLTGGRDITAENNIIVNTSVPVNYEQHEIGDEVLKALKASPYQSEIWKDYFPGCAQIVFDAQNKDDPVYYANPSNSRVENNVILSLDKSFGNISEQANRFSKFENNALFELTDGDVFTNAKRGDYTLAENSAAVDKMLGFENLPFELIGRY